jgi:hypothetical protein
MISAHRIFALAFLSPIVWSAVACSGSSAPSIGSSPDAAAADGGGTSSGASSSGASSGGSSGTSSGNTGDAGGSDGSTSGDGGGDGGQKLAPIDPLVVGHTWSYDVSEIGTYPLCPSGRHDAKIISSGPRDGKTAFQAQSLCAYAGTFYYAADGDVVYWDNAGTWILSLDAPVTEGHTWSNGVTSYVWHDAGSVTVPAGTFTDCWKAQDTGGPSFTIFCRGVGPVHWSYRDASSNGYDALLAAKNF